MCSTLNPRRRPANESVSLVRSHRQKRARTHSPGKEPSLQSRESTSTTRSSTSPPEPVPYIRKDDSGESSNAEKWFDRSNHHTSGDGDSFCDNDPPFFLQTSSSDRTPAHAPGQAGPRFAFEQSGNGAFAAVDGLRNTGDDDSSTEDYRGVIDDLTVENKKLKKKLRMLERYHDPHLRDEKLFEVRVHGLPVEKKRELEELLRRFTMELGGQDAGSMGPKPDEFKPPGFSARKTNSSFPSNQFTDSAYISGSNSGQGSYHTAPSLPSGSSVRKEKYGQSARARQQNIHSYLHDIPAGLLPSQPTVMTDKTKKKLVVRRLEELFAGKGAAGSHQQPLQQQEVSQSAAQADRSATEASGQVHPAEGGREAPIMDHEGEDCIEPSLDSTHRLTPTIKVSEHDFAYPQTVQRPAEQRPTRPLDLDPHREQIPMDNIRYIRHLGFSPPNASSMSPPQGSHGWIYLNVLTNMAQLHTINVTTEYVLKALMEYSKKIEVSADGRKVRWSGGRSLTRSDSDVSPSLSPAGHSSGYGDTRPGRRSRLAHQESSSSNGDETVPARPAKPETRLAYTPLFHHRSGDGDSAYPSGEDEDLSTALPFQISGDQHGMQAVSSQKHQGTAGPMIFYNNARFCTDLSGDPNIEMAMQYNYILYHSIKCRPVGDSAPTSLSTSESGERRGSLGMGTIADDAMDVDGDDGKPDIGGLSFPPRSPMAAQPGKNFKTHEFVVSGLDGIRPADNFAIHVQSRHARRDGHEASQTTRLDIPRAYTDNISSILQNAGKAKRAARSAQHEEILSTDFEQFRPSQVPEASCFMPEDESDSETEFDPSDMLDTHDAPTPAAAPQPITVDYRGTEEFEDEYDEDADDDDDDDDESEGSLDLLATARELDPETIRAREREYDASMAERLAEEIPAGSSAATAGGGSGFASPAAGVGKEAYEQAKRVYKATLAKQARPELKRALSSDSMLVNGS